MVRPPFLDKPVQQSCGSLSSPHLGFRWRPSGQPMPGAPGSKVWVSTQRCAVQGFLSVSCEEYDARRAKALKLLDESISSLLVHLGEPVLFGNLEGMGFC